MTTPHLKVLRGNPSGLSEKDVWHSESIQFRIFVIFCFYITFHRYAYRSAFLTSYNYIWLQYDIIIDSRSFFFHRKSRCFVGQCWPTAAKFREALFCVHLQFQSADLEASNLKKLEESLGKCLAILPKSPGQIQTERRLKLLGFSAFYIELFFFFKKLEKKHEHPWTSMNPWDVCHLGLIDASETSGLSVSEIDLGGKTRLNNGNAFVERCRVNWRVSCHFGLSESDQRASQMKKMGYKKKETWRNGKETVRNAYICIAYHSFHSWISEVVNIWRPPTLRAPSRLHFDRSSDFHGRHPQQKHCTRQKHDNHPKLTNYRTSNGIEWNRFLQGLVWGRSSLGLPPAESYASWQMFVRHVTRHELGNPQGSNTSPFPSSSMLKHGDIQMPRSEILWSSNDVTFRDMMWLRTIARNCC